MTEHTTHDDHEYPGRKPLSHDYPSPGQCPGCHWPQGRMCHCEKSDT